MSRRKKITCIEKHFIFAFLFYSFFCFGQNTEYRIDITGIHRVTHKNWLFIPKSADYTLYWDAFQNSGSGWKAADGFSIFRVKCTSDSDFRQVDVQRNFCTFFNCKAGKKYRFEIEGFQNQQKLAVSDSAWIITGKPPKKVNFETQSGLVTQGPMTRSKWHHWIPINGRIPLALIGKGLIFDQSSNAGKVSFHLIWIFCLAGIAVWLLLCHRRLKINKIFPMDKNTLIFHGLDENYKNRESKTFRDILNVWRDKSSDAVGELLLQLDNLNWNHYPTVRIIKAGLEKNNKNRNIQGIELTKEIERSIENRASSELELMKRKSFIEWLWNLGTLSPLLGLFGTVTGISQSFGVLSGLQEDISQKELMNKLAGGIHEALWTTIEGLIVGIIFMLLYYYYQTKINWIYSKWEEIYVYVAEKL